MHVFPAQYPGSNASTIVKQRAGPEILSLIPRLAIIKNDMVCDICKEITENMSTRNTVNIQTNLKISQRITTK